MASLPHFVFPAPSEETQALSESTAAPGNRTEQPQLGIHTSTATQEAYRLASARQEEHPKLPPVGTLSIPLISQTTSQSSSMGSSDPRSIPSGGAHTPPLTPTSASHSKSSSTSSDFLNTLSSLRRGDSTSSRDGSRPSLDGTSKRSTSLLTFPHHLTDYNIKTDSEGRKKRIGEGLWSDVYLAKPSLPKPAEKSFLATPTGADITPPVTPVHSRNSSLGSSQLPVVPPLYAIKVPASTSAKKVLSAEARIISYLSRLPGADRHIVPFFGLDTRTGALVLKAMDMTLETWIQKELNTLDEASRAQKLATVFPAIATALVDSLSWMQDQGCTHADIKPSNILVSTSSPVPQTVYSDFSSTILTVPTVDTSIETSPVGAGTWDYLDPALLSFLDPATPSEASDLWSLAITLLFLVIGSSPYEAFKVNKYQQREMIKSGSPIQCLTYGDEGIKNLKRLKTLSAKLGFDVQKWFAKVLVKKSEKRVGIVEWKEELGRAVATM